MMKFVRYAMAAAAMSFAFGTGAQAQDVETRPIEAKHLESGKHQLNPEKGYLFTKANNRTNAMFIKEPSAEDIAEYEAEWLEKFEKAKKKYPGQLKRWQLSKDMGRNPGPKPIEPTEENFAIGSLDARMLAGFGPTHVFSKEKTAEGDNVFTYLTELEPGTYTYLGPIFQAPNGQVAGTCYCMGSVKLEIKAGAITNLGDFLAEGWVDLEARKQASIHWEAFKDRVAYPADYSTPESLMGLPVVHAELFAAGKRNNVLNLMVGRMPPVEGVLAYDRDTPVDVKGLLARQAAEEAQAAQDKQVVVEEASETAPETAAERLEIEPAAN